MPIVKIVSPVRACLLAIAALCLTTGPASYAADERLPVTQLATNYGAPQFDRVEKLVFSVNRMQGEQLITRTWAWWPHSEELLFIGQNASGDWVRSAFFRNELTVDSPAPQRQLEQTFRNDLCWLMLPVAASRDAAAKAAALGPRPLPAGGGQASALHVTFPATTVCPPVAYDIYLGTDQQIAQWTVQDGASTVSTTWAEPAHVGPLLLNLAHRTADGKPLVWFSNILVIVREDTTAAIPSVSEFTAKRYQADSKVETEMRAVIRAAQEAEERRQAEIARQEAEKKRQAELVAAASKTPPATPTVTTPTVATTPAVPTTPVATAPATPTTPVATTPSASELAAQAAAAEKAKQAALAAEKARQAELAAAEKAEKARQAELAAAEKARLAAAAKTPAVSVATTTSAPVPPSQSRAALDSDIAPDITVTADGYKVQGLTPGTEQVKDYLAQVAKRDRHAKITIRLATRYSSANYINLLNTLQQSGLRDYIVVKQ